jgi:glycosyltransferase involved in cell wall biosynthesis
VTAVARFIIEAAERSSRYDVTLISLASSFREPLSQRLISPGSWLGASSEEGIWEGRPFTHVGSPAAELEVCRYARRRVLSDLLKSVDIVHVVAGAPAWALPVIGSGKPVSLHVATRVKVERRMRDQAGGTAPAWWQRTMTRAVSRMELKAMRSVDAIQVMNYWMLEQALELNSDRPDVDVRLAPPGVDDTLFRPAPRTDGRGRYILSVGRFGDPRKNVGLLLDAFARIASSTPDVMLVTAGATPPPATYWNEVARLGLTDRVRHVARPGINELVGLYQQAEVFALASDEEGLGVVLLEAMSCSVPVVSTRSGGPDGVITDGHDGFLTERGDAAELGDKIALLLQDHGRRQIMGLAARRTVEARYAKHVASEQFVEVWDRLLDRRRA